MRLVEILDAIEETSSRNKKEEILTEHCHNQLLREFLWYALNPYKVYHLANIEQPTTTTYIMELYQPIVEGMNIQEALELSHFKQLWELLDMLDAGEIVGNEARIVVNQFLLELPEPEQKWAYRCVLKDLKAGMTSKTVNKVIPGLVPEFNVALADTLEVKDGKFKPELAFPVWVDNKLDGIRAVCVKKGRTVSFFTRKGHAIETLPIITQAIEAASATDFMLDGEVMGRSWNESQSTVFATKNTVDDSGMIYNVFDSMPVNAWESQQCDFPYLARREFANELLKSVSHTQVRLVGGKMVSSAQAIHEVFRDTVQAGFEGIMIKDPNAPYNFKRSRAILKLKPKNTWEGRVVGWEKGALNSKWQDSFGAFQVEFNGVVTSVGGGFTDSMRVAIFANVDGNPEYYNGKIAEVEGQDMTPDGKIRFPVFKRFRDERDQ